MTPEIEHYRDYIIHIFPRRLILFYKGKRVAGIYCNRVTEREIDQIREIVDHIQDRIYMAVSGAIQHESRAGQIDGKNHDKGTYYQESIN